MVYNSSDEQQEIGDSSRIYIHPFGDIFINGRRMAESAGETERLPTARNSRRL
jgi:hypothetical protein